LRADLARLDFLDGSAASASGARPKHLLELQAGFYRRGLGARLSGNLQSASFVRGAEDAGGDLRFSPLATANLRIFVDFGQRPQLLRRLPWLRDARLSGGVTNLFNARPRVRDRGGQTPFGYQPAYLDPVGRFAGISLRKLFT
jgi:outer membrane receptor protein involved in Fe transport